MGKVEVVEVSYEVRLKAASPISKPMASKKQTKKFHKLVKKGAKAKVARRGVKEVCKGLRQGKKGLCIIAGDISPIDVVSHLAYHCEEKGVPYIYVPSKVDLGSAAKTKRPTSCVLITQPKPGTKEEWDGDELYQELVETCKEEMSQIPQCASDSRTNQAKRVNLETFDALHYDHAIDRQKKWEGHDNQETRDMY